MKLIIAIVQDEDTSRLITELINEGISATKLATTGGFLKSGNTTLLIGVDDSKVDDTLALIEKVCRSRQQMTVNPIANGAMGGIFNQPISVNVGGATVFILAVEQFVKM